VAFASAAAICAGLAAGASGGAPTDAEGQFGELREVVVTNRALPARRTLTRSAIDEGLELRRVPERFVAPDALADPAQALGRRPAATIPAGGYLVGSQLLQPGEAAQASQPELEAGRRPVEITVEGAGTLAGSAGRRVDVVITTEATPGGGAGRTYIAARRVALLDLRPVGGEGTDGGIDVIPGPPTEASIAILALTRAQALRLIHAQSFAREVRLIGR
jgi:Flp pilus assembly protein CpaB